MNSLYRVFTNSSKRTSILPLSSFSLSYSTRKRKPTVPVPSSPPSPTEELEVPEDISILPRPTEIPFQPKVANSVNFIGVVQSPIQFLASLDGNYWAGTIISQDQPSNSPLSIPIVFEGDLAHTAACHIKENDNIYIAGHLSADKLPLSLTSSQDNFQVMVHSLNFVQGSPYAKSQFASHMQDLKSTTSVGGKKAFDTSSWEDLVNNPTKWRDFRNDKLNNVVKPKYPDFKHKEDGRALWLNSAPFWIVEKLEGLEFNGQVGMANKSPGNRDFQGSGVDSWKDLIENPSKWWDNRSNKATTRHPDFRHKDTGEGLWLNRAPEWALQQLPPGKPVMASTNSSNADCDYLY